MGRHGLIRRIDICGKSATERAVNVAADEYIAAFDPSRGGLVMASKLLDEKGDTFRFLASDGTVTKRSATEVGSPESPFPANYVLDANRNLLLTVEDAGGTFVVVEHPLAAQENYGRTFVVDKPR